METIQITEEQRNKLCQELARLTYQFRKDNNIKGIYFAPYNGLEDEIEGNVILVTLVRDNHEDVDFHKILDEYNKSHQEQNTIDELGFQIYLNADNPNKYTTFDLNPSDSARSNNLMNSTILYDEDGYFKKIKEQTTRKFNGGITNIYYYYDNLVQVSPPLDETLYNALDDAREERDTEAVKEFTKSKLFQDFKKII